VGSRVHARREGKLGHERGFDRHELLEPLLGVVLGALFSRGIHEQSLVLDLLGDKLRVQRDQARVGPAFGQQREALAAPALDQGSQEQPIEQAALAGLRGAATQTLGVGIRACICELAAELAAAKEFIAKAALPSAGRALDQAQGKMPGPKGRVAVSELRDELALLRTLTAIVPTNAFADASNIYAVRLPAGDLVVAKVPNAADEKAESLTIKLRDGRQLSIRRSRIQSIKPVAPQEFRRIVMRELRARERELGKDPNPVEAFRTVVSFCLEYGMRVKAMTVLQAALRKPAGSVLVALFCEVEARRHRRTQARLAGIKEPNLLAALSIDRPEPVSVNEPSAPPPELTPSPSAPAPAPQARPQPKPIRDKPDVMEDSRWTKAGALYKRGIDIYRGSFSGSSKSVQNVSMPPARRSSSSP